MALPVLSELTGTITNGDYLWDFIASLTSSHPPSIFPLKLWGNCLGGLPQEFLF